MKRLRLGSDQDLIPYPSNSNLREWRRTNQETCVSGMKGWEGTQYSGWKWTSTKAHHLEISKH